MGLQDDRENVRVKKMREKMLRKISEVNKDLEVLVFFNFKNKKLKKEHTRVSIYVIIKIMFR